MKSPGNRIYHLLFVIAIVGLTVFKWHDLHLPFFWDELGVYGPAADYQYQHQLSLMPASVPTVLSRGHPLLFTFMNAAVMRLLGQKVFVSHFFCFSLSLVLLAAVYVKISRYLGPLSGILSVVILAIQPLFLAQSGLILPEIALTLFIFLALCSYHENRFLQFALFASLAILTKEGAVVLPVTVIGYSILCWIFARVKPYGLKPRALFFTLVPYLIFGLFLVVQKRQSGWYLFPYHMEFVAFDVGRCLSQIRLFKTFIFHMQGRNFLTCVMLCGAIFALLKGRFSFNRIGRSFLFLLILFVMAFTAMSSLVDLYMERYLMTLLLAFSILAAAALTTISTNRIFATVVVIMAVVISARNFDNGIFNCDSDLGYRRTVNSLQQGVNYLNQIARPGSKVFGPFPAYCALSFPPGGYLTKDQADLLKVDSNGEYYLLLVNPGVPYQFDTTKRRMNFLKRFDDGFANANVYWIEYK